jgi:hypothetical protein
MKLSHVIISRHVMTLAILTASLLGFTCSTARAQSLEACEPSPTVKAGLDQVPSYQSPDQTDWQYHERRLSAIQALLKQFPDDLFAQRAFINFMTRVGRDEFSKTIEQYKARYEQKPNDPQRAYLYGLTLVGRKSPEAIKLFDEARGKAPKFSWPHLSLVRIYMSPAFLDKEKAKTHMKAFLATCPSSLEGYEQLTRMDDRELARQGAEKLRPVLQARRDPKGIGAYTMLWALEFKAHPPAEYDPLRKQVAEDLRRIRALTLEDKMQWYEALEEGYKLANDQKQSDWAKDERLRRFPRPWELAAMEKWRKDHKEPSPEDLPEKKRAYYSEVLKQTDMWLKERPNSTFIWWQRLDAMEHLDNVPSTEIKAAIEGALQVAQRNAGPKELNSYDYFNIAELLSRKELEPARLVELSRKGLEQLEIELKEPIFDLYATKENVESNRFWQVSQRIQGLVFETDGHLRLKQSDKAQGNLARLDEHLRELMSLAGDKASRKKDCSSRESAYWGLTARVAEIQDKKLDAMAYYESALLARLQAQEKPETGQKDELAENARKLWSDLGGTEEGWKNWYGRRADALAATTTLTWEDANQPLPSFELADLRGKTWSTADLKGKVTFLNFWASW